jgi:hypothetical protein
MLLAASLSCSITVSADEFRLTSRVVFEGAVDGSAGAGVGDGFFIGATDEENQLRLYDSKNGAHAKKLDVDVEGAVKTALGVDKFKECDLEGAAKMGDLIFWIGSHGRNSEAKDAQLKMEGQVYTKLLDDLINDPALAPFDLATAATRAPKDKGALNIESLAADDGKLWIGFRNPIKDGKALMVPLLNPREVIEKDGKARLGEPITLNLSGLGFRDMVRWHDSFLIIAGDFIDRFDQEAKPAPRPSRLFSWKLGTEPHDIGVNLGDLNPEAIVIMDQGDKSEILILSDDGKYPDRAGKNVFRGVWLQDVDTAKQQGQRTDRNPRSIDNARKARENQVYKDQFLGSIKDRLVPLQ